MITIDRGEDKHEVSPEHLLLGQAVSYIAHLLDLMDEAKTSFPAAAMQEADAFRARYWPARKDYWRHLEETEEAARQFAKRWDGGAQLAGEP